MTQYKYYGKQTVGDVFSEFFTDDFEAMREFLGGRDKPTEFLKGTWSVDTRVPDLPITYSEDQSSHWKLVVKANGKVVSDSRFSLYKEAFESEEVTRNVFDILGITIDTSISLEDGSIESPFTIMASGEILTMEDVKEIYSDGKATS